MSDDDCICGHPVSAHTLPITEPGGNVAPPQQLACSECYCGRDMLAGAHITQCGWCATADPVVWCLTENGRRMMVQPEPDASGNCEIRWTGSGAPLVVVHGSPPGMFDDWTPYRPHFADCDQKLRPERP